MATTQKPTQPGISQRGPNLTALSRRNDHVVKAMVDGTEPTPVSVLSQPSHAPVHSVSALTPGQAYSVPVQLFKRSEVGARIHYNNEEVDELVTSLQVHKQITPVTGYVSGDRITVIDGGKRLTACLSGGIPELLVYILPAPEDKTAEYVRSYVANHVRSEQTPFDDAQRFRMLLDSGYLQSQDELAEMLQINKSHVSKILRLSAIPEPYRRFMVDRPEHFPLTVAYSLAPLFEGTDGTADALPSEKIMEILNDVCNRSLGSRAVDALLKDLFKEKATRMRAQQLPVTYGEHKGVLKMNRTRGEFSIQFKGVPAEQIDVIEQKLQDWLKEISSAN